jgi:hypothetical protein
VIPGNHETIFHEPNVQVMAQTLQECIDRALAQQRSNVLDVNLLENHLING